MSTVPEALSTARHKLAEAESHLADCDQVEQKHAEHAAAKRLEATQSRENLLASRMAGLGGTTVSEVQDIELDADAAEALYDQLKQRSADAKSAVEAARRKLDEAIADAAQAIETDTHSDIHAHLEGLFRALVRSVAAAKVSRDHGRTLGSNHLGLSHMFGLGGRLLSMLQSLDWPRGFDDHGFKNQWAGQSPTAYPGVDEQLSDIRLKLGINA